jgi:DNA end-binding protein Ku
MRPTWSGVISFGLVNIPVGLYSATQDKDLTFHLLHKEDHGRIKNQRVCTICGRVMTPDDLVKGFEYARRENVTLTEEDFDSVAVPSSNRIEIQDFVDSQQIDPIYYEAPYYIQPEDSSATAYNLLRGAMEKTGKVGIAKIAFRTKERLAALVAGRSGLVLYTMHFADEIRAAEPAPAVSGVGERETRMAEALINAMAEDFHPEKYHDESREALQKLVEAKKEGIAVSSVKVESPPTNVIDLMQMLKDSIEQKEQGKPDEKKKPAAKKSAGAAA